MADPMTTEKPTGNAIKDNMSIFNPADIAPMAEEAQKGKTVGDVLATFGISPDDPAEALLRFGKKQVENANPMTKMANIAKQAGGQGPSPTPSGSETNPLDQLVGI